MTDFSVAGSHAVVVGAARSGLAAAELLAARGAWVTITDVREDVNRPATLTGEHVRFELGAHRPQTFTQADLVVVSPGVPPEQPAIQAARRAGVPVIGELELASRWLQGRIVAITGTKGKSTTTALTGRMLDAAGFRTLVGGNIGSALSTQVSRSTPDAIHVVEVSSFQLELTEEFHPWIAVILNFSPDHLDRHVTVDRYADAKARILANQDASDWAVANADDPHVFAMVRRGRAQQMTFGLSATRDDGIAVSENVIVRRSGSATLVPLVPVSAVRLLGRHLLGDVLASVAVATILGVSADVMAQAVAAFDGLEHVLEPVEEIDGIQFVNDSKATNVEATRHAIESVRPDLVIILGGQFKGGDWRVLRPALRAHARAIVAIGEARPLIRDALADLVPVHDARSMAEAVRTAFGLAPAHGTVLLAPACASFDMFRDYAERGRCFKEEVRQLARERLQAREQ